MGKALVLKGTDFSANRLDTVTFNDIPCTGISLSSSTATVATTTTLTATLTPANTTDTVVWESSDTRVATVNNGVVTAESNGTATITATCGQFSATCAVTVAIPMIGAKPGMTQVIVQNGTLADALTPANTSSTSFASVGGTSGDYIAAWSPAVENTNYELLYPYKIPQGAKTISVTLDSNIASLIVYYNRNEHGAETTGYPNRAKVLDGETSAGGTQWSIADWVYGNRTYTISTVEGVNSFTLGLYFKTSAAYDAFDLSNPAVGITFGYE